MTPTPSPQITELLQAWSAGDQSAFVQIVELTYPELQRIARRHLQHERLEHTIQATALVKEACLRLVNLQHEWKDGAHFLAVGSRIMRRILVDNARTRPKMRREERNGSETLGKD
jgi:RNA polymerase sigma factor (TIGR02999 family)